MIPEKQYFICTDVDYGYIYMNVEPNGIDELTFHVEGVDTQEYITISKYDAIELANFILNKFK